MTKPLILLVDDTPTNLLILRSILSQENEILDASSGALALELAAQHHPDVVLLDVVMPDMDGYEVCRRLKADPALQSIPIVFLTALDEEEDEMRGLELGAIDFISKPVSPAIVQARVRNIVKFHRQQRVLAELAQGAQRAKEAFIDRLSHELRTPLTPIMGLTELMLEEASDPETSRRYLEAIQASASRLLQVFDLLIESTRIEVDAAQERKVHFEPRSLLTQLHQDFLPKAQSQSIKLELLLKPGLPDHCPGDPMAVEKLLRVLLSNALRFTKIGTICLETNVLKLPDGQVLDLEVADTGTGIPPERLEQLFQPIPSGRGEDSLSSGLGAGLTLARQLATLMGGSLRATSTPGQGSRFSFRIPL